MKQDAEIIVTRDGFWPTMWCWETEVKILVRVGEGMRSTKTKRISGMAVTKNRAFKVARKAQETAEVGR